MPEDPQELIGAASATESDEDGLLDALEAARPGQTDAVGLALRSAVRRSLVGVKGEPFRLGRFTVLEPLGRGGMGTVFVAYDPDLDRKIALKVLHRRGERGRREVLREGRALARLKHPNVVTVYDVGVVGDQVFVAMEHVAGISLRAWLRERRAAGQILSLLVEAGRGLAAAHDADLVHLDIKPENLIVDAGGHARVIDFGLARSLEDAESAPTSTGSTASRESTVRGGTPGYIAPERMLGARGDPRADQFSFCVTCWEALFGQRPRIGEEPPARATGVPPRVVRALRRGMSRAPGDRFASMHALLAELEVRPQRRRLGGLALAAAFGLVLGGYVVGPRDGSAGPRCSPPRELLTAWDSARASAIGAAFRATGVPFARATWASVRPSLDRFADAWSAAQARACEETVVLGVASEETFARRRLCLADRRIHFLALLERFAAADADTVTHAHAALEGLPSVADCERADLGGFASPADPRRVQDFIGRRSELARARVEAETGRPEAVAPLVERLIAGARADGNHSLLVDALLVASNLDDIADRTALSAGRAQEALALALERVAPVKAARAALRLVYLRRKQHAGAPFQEDLLALADAICRQAGDPLELRGNVLFHRGLELRATRRCQEAILELERTRDFALAHEVRDLAAAALVQLGLCHAELGDYASSRAANEQALAEMEASIGAMHPTLAGLHNNVATVLMSLDELELATRHLERGAAITRVNFGDEHGTLGAVRVNLATIYVAQGRHEEAIVEYRRARADLERSRGPWHAESALARCAVGLPLRALGRFEEGLHEAGEALRIQTEVLPPGDCDRLACTALHAEFLHELGRDAEALAELEPALALAGQGRCPKEQRGDLELTTARVLWALRGEQARARILALLAEMSPLSDETAVARAERLRAALR